MVLASYNRQLESRDDAMSAGDSVIKKRSSIHEAALDERISAISRRNREIEERQKASTTTIVDHESCLCS